MEQTAVDEMRSRIFRKLLKYFLPFPCSSFQKAFGSDRLLYDDKNKLNKNFLKEVFSLHYNQPDLKVSYYIREHPLMMSDNFWVFLIPPPHPP